MEHVDSWWQPGSWEKLYAQTETLMIRDPRVRLSLGTEIVHMLLKESDQGSNNGGSASKTPQSPQDMSSSVFVRVFHRVTAPKMP